MKLRMLSLITALTMLLSVTALAAEVPGIGTITQTSATKMADNAVLTQNTLLHSAAGLQAEHYFELKAGSQIKPVVVAGSTVYGDLMTLDTAAERLKALGYDVAAGVNGDFFTVATGVPQGMVVTEGIIRNSDQGVSAIGFQRDGTAFISRPSLATTFTYGNANFTVNHINKIRTAMGLYLYTSDFGTTTNTTTSGTNVILEVSDSLRIGKTIKATVTSVYSGTASVTLKAGQMCLSAEATDAVARISALKAGDTINISTASSDKRYENCDYIIGAYHQLVENGAVVTGLETARQPRTAVGVKADGTMVFYTVDGRKQEYSVGLGLNEVAARMVSLGCIAAIELDGGGSTDMLARYPGDSSLTRLGKPSDGSPRKVATLIMFVNAAEYTETPRQIFAKQSTFAALPGGTVNIGGNFSAIDTNYHPLEITSPSWITSNEYVATVSQQGVVSAVSAGKCNITISFNGVSSSVELNVLEQPDSIRLVDVDTGKTVTELNLDMFEIVKLKAVGIIDGKEVSGGQFEWFTQDAGVASVDQNGMVTAGSRFGDATRLIVGMGTRVQSIFVTVGKGPVLLEGFENTGTAFSASSVGTGYSIEKNKQNVKYGLFAGSFAYDFSLAPDGTAALSYNCNLNLADKPPFVSLWIKGDGSGNMLNIAVTDASGGLMELPVTKLDFTDYRPIVIPMANISKINTFKLIKMPGSSAKGAFTIDQIMSMFSDEQDTTQPSLSVGLKLDAASGVLEINASAVDYGAPALKQSNITLTMDGITLPFTFNGTTGELTASIAAPDEGYHRITVTARDDSGNYSKESRIFDQPTTLKASSYADIEEHWSMSLVEYLDRKSIFQTAASADGKRYFRPDAGITRADVAVYMSRVLKLDEARWQSITLPYTDLADIPQSALGAVKALYGNGYMMGQSVNGKLIFGPNTTLTRAESFAVIGRAIPQGTTVNADIEYADADTIPEYATSFVKLLAGMGIINDSNIAQKVNPQNKVTRAEFAKMLAMMT